MPYIRLKGIVGRVYVPGTKAGAAEEKKHPCPDCSFCQWCSDERCALCLSSKKCGRGKGQACARAKRKRP